MMHDYCFCCRDRPSDDDFYLFHDLIRTNGSCPAWTWTIPDDKCGSYDVGLPFSHGIQNRVILRSPTTCYCHQMDRYRFACDYMNGAIVFFIEVMPFIGLSFGIITMCITLGLVAIPTYVRKVRTLRKKAGKEIIMELIDLKFLSVVYMSITSPFMVASDICEIDFLRTFIS
jgi:hypothetical protein